MTAAHKTSCAACAAQNAFDVLGEPTKFRPYAFAWCLGFSTGVAGVASNQLHEIVSGLCTEHGNDCRNILLASFPLGLG
jgi:hypothetical protein